MMCEKGGGETPRCTAHSGRCEQPRLAICKQPSANQRRIDPPLKIQLRYNSFSVCESVINHFWALPTHTVPNEPHSSGWVLCKHSRRLKAADKLLFPLYHIGMSTVTVTAYRQSPGRFQVMQSDVTFPCKSSRDSYFPSPKTQSGQVGLHRRSCTHVLHALFHKCSCLHARKCKLHKFPDLRNAHYPSVTQQSRKWEWR